MEFVFGVALENHEPLVIKHKIRSFIESRQHPERPFEFECLLARIVVTGRGAFADAPNIFQDSGESRQGSFDIVRFFCFLQDFGCCFKRQQSRGTLAR